MTKLKVDPGVCGLLAEIEAVSEDGETVTFTIDTACPGISELAESLEGEQDIFELLGMMGEPSPLESNRGDYPIHGTCPVISGILKCVEVEAHMALPKNVSMEFI